MPRMPGTGAGSGEGRGRCEVARLRTAEVCVDPVSLTLWGLGTASETLGPGVARGRT